MSWPVHRRFTLGIVLLGALVCLIGCSSTTPPTDIEPSVTEALKQRLEPRITDISVTRNQAVVEWEVDRQRGDVIKGYNVYVGTQPELDELALDDDRLVAVLYNQSTYPGDTDGDIHRESIVLDRLETGVRYFVHVRTLFPSGEASPPSAEMAFVPRPQGVITLHPRLSGQSDGYSFANDTTVESQSLLNDLYIYTVRDTAFLASPSRLNAELRDTRFVNLGDADEFAAYPDMTATDGHDKIALHERQVIGLRLGDNRIAKLRIVTIDRGADPPAVTFQYRYQPIAGETQF